MVERARGKTNGHEPAASPGRQPTAREVARFERFLAERKPMLDRYSDEEVDAMVREALKQVDKKQFLREAKALRDGMKERQAARDSQEVQRW